MDLNKFTIKSQEAIQRAQQIAMEMGQQAIENGHLLKGIAETDENVLPFILKKLSVNTDIFYKTLDKIIESYPKVEGGNIHLSRYAGESINRAISSLKEWNDEFVSLEHLIIAIFKGGDSISQLMKDNGVTEKSLKAAVTELRKGQRVTSASAEDSYNALTKYAKNLNQLAKENKLDPVIGRDEEIRRLLQILSRRTKNNPILIGEPGVGKTAIAEGLAHRII